MSKPKKFKALIIGAGRIASGFDNPKTREILTHAHAYKVHPKIELLGFYDAISQTAIVAAKKWSVKSFNDLEVAIKTYKPEIISICTPDSNHFVQLKMLANLIDKPKIVICEKPLTARLSDTSKILKIYKNKKIPVLVNHSRRFDKTVQNIRRKLIKGQFGRVVLGNAIYGQGLLHSGTHIIDLARYFFGEMISSKTLYELGDFKKEDKSKGVFIKFKGCEQFYLQPSDCRNYDLFEFNIIAQKGRITFTDLGFKYSEQNVINDPMYRGYKILSQPRVQKTNFDQAMYNLVDNAVKHLTSGQELICNLEDAAKTHQACMSIKNN